MNYSLFEWAIIAFIVLAIGFTIWRGGAANPEGTGSIARKLAAMKAQLAGLDAEVKSIDGRVAEIDRRTATIDDIRKIERVLEEHGKCLKELDDGQTAIREMAASRGSKLDAIGEQVGRLYDVLVPRGLSK